VTTSTPDLLSVPTSEEHATSGPVLEASAAPLGERAIGARTRGVGARVDAWTFRTARLFMERVPKERRERARRAFLLVRQRLHAAELLFAQGHRAEALAILERGAASGVEAAQALSDREDAAAALAAIGFDERDVATMMAALDALAARTERLEGEIAGADQDRYYALLSSMRRSIVFLDQATFDRPLLVMRVVKRAAWIAAGVAAFATFVFFATYDPPRLEATATQTQGDWPAEFAVDGRPRTEWIGHDRQLPELTIAVVPPRDLTAVRILNGHNRHYNDRAVKDYRVELYRGQELVQGIDGTFPSLSPSPEWVEHPVDAPGIDRVKLIVRSFHRTGAAIAEIELVD
jgi:hypothetical protein